MTGTTYHLTGNTYPHRRWLSQRGAQWDADARHWVLTLGGNGTRRLLTDLHSRGIRAAQV
jgi:hypothetical protein